MQYRGDKYAQSHGVKSRGQCSGAGVMVGESQREVYIKRGHKKPLEHIISWGYTSLPIDIGVDWDGRRIAVYGDDLGGTTLYVSLYDFDGVELFNKTFNTNNSFPFVYPHLVRVFVQPYSDGASPKLHISYTLRTGTYTSEYYVDTYNDSGTLLTNNRLPSGYLYEGNHRAFNFADNLAYAREQNISTGVVSLVQMNMDGTNVQILHSPLAHPTLFPFTVDVVRGKIYLYGGGADDYVCDLDGGNMEVSTVAVHPSRAVANRTARWTFHNTATVLSPVIYSPFAPGANQKSSFHIQYLSGIALNFVHY